MSTPKTVVFDLGKVLVDFDYEIAGRKIAACSPLGAASVRQMLDHTPLLFRFETGLMTREEFFREVCAGTAYRGTIDEFSESFADIFSEIEPMIALHAALRAQGVPTYIFSNTNEIAVGHIRRRFPFFSNFDGYILSFQEGAMKPTAKIYESVERLTGHSGPSIVYLDDRPENVEAGAARGWRAILHQTPEATLAALDALGLPIPGSPTR